MNSSLSADVVSEESISGDEGRQWVNTAIMVLAVKRGGPPKMPAGLGIPGNRFMIHVTPEFLCLVSVSNASTRHFQKRIYFFFTIAYN